MSKLGNIPLFFLGLGVYRAWIEIVFVGSFVNFPAVQSTAHDLFDISMACTLLAAALLASRLKVLFNKRSAYVLSALLLCASTAGMFATLFAPQLTSTLALPSALAGGIGIAILILLWSELYSCLNMVRVVLYYSGSIVVGALIIYECRGLSAEWLCVNTILMPLVSLGCVAAAFRSLPKNEQPAPFTRSFTFPVKPVLLMAIYAFAYGLKEASVYTSSFGPHSSLGTMVIALAVFAGVIARGERFDFLAIYRVALPLMVAAFLILPTFGFFSSACTFACVTASYTAFSILIMLILANMSYRYGVSALWLFGLERGVRALFNVLGRKAELGFSALIAQNVTYETTINTLVIVLVVALTMILFSEKELTSLWGITYIDDPAAEGAQTMNKQELAVRCQDLARAYSLSAREEEVLQLLAQRKSIGAIEKELFIANGTAKAHIRHIYRKLDIHSRKELLAKIGLRL